MAAGNGPTTLKPSVLITSLFRIKADLGLPARDQLHAAFERRSVDDPAFHRIGDTELLDQFAHMGAARCRAGRRMGDRAAVQDCLLDLVRCRQIRLRRTGTHHRIDADEAEDGATFAPRTVLSFW